MGRVKREVGRVEGGGDEGHPRQGALSQKTAGFVDDEKPSITHEAMGIKPSGGNRESTKRFNRVKKKAAEAHARIFSARREVWQSWAQAQRWAFF